MSDKWWSIVRRMRAVARLAVAADRRVAAGRAIGARPVVAAGRAIGARPVVAAGLAAMTALAVLASLAAAPGSAVAKPGKFNKVLAPGDPAPAWTGLEGTDGRKHALADLKDKEIVVVVFTCNSCPVAVAYEERIQAFVAKYCTGPAARVALVAINVNTGREDALPAMRQRAADRGFRFPYLYDPSQRIARQYGATFTPEFFVLDRQRRVAYTGAMDDRAPPGTPTRHYLVEAVEAVLAGKPVAVAETSAAAGCKIKYNPQRDDD